MIRSRFVGKISTHCFLSVILVASVLLCSSSLSFGQNVDDYLSDGEFSAAIDVAGNNDQLRQQIAQAQFDTGETGAAMQTVGSMLSESFRTKALNFQQGPGDPSGGFGGGAFGGGSGSFGAAPNGNAGGITSADFTTLIQLIQNTVSSDTWEANGGGNGTIFPYPAGVYVNGEGVLNRIKKSKLKFVFADNFKASMLPRGPVGAQSDMRKVSLTRLERAVQLRAAQGKAPTEAMQNFAGLTQIRYVMIDPDTGEVIIAGPAGDWQTNAKGKVVSAVDQQPVLSLDDFVTCLRNAFGNAGKFGCSIVPRKENLARTKQYVSTQKGRGKKWENGLREALGQQDIEVFGIPAKSHAARVLVEADHHMKLVGMGIEPSIPAVPSYLERVKLDANGNPPPMDVVRWWFSLNYDQLVSNEKETLFEFRGSGVKVLAETEFINGAGDRIHTGKAIGPTATFARDFTDNFERLADVYPVYNELKNVFDLAIVANLIHEYEFAEKADWRMPFFVSSNEESSRSWQSEMFNAATAVDSVMNRHVLRDRRDGETTIHTLIGVSGGVSFDASSYVKRKNLRLEKDLEFTGQLTAAIEKLPQDTRSWWWD